MKKKRLVYSPCMLLHSPCAPDRTICLNGSMAEKATDTCTDGGSVGFVCGAGSAAFLLSSSDHACFVHGYSAANNSTNDTADEAACWNGWFAATNTNPMGCSAGNDVGLWTESGCWSGAGPT